MLGLGCGVVGRGGGRSDVWVVMFGGKGRRWVRNTMWMEGTVEEVMLGMACSSTISTEVPLRRDGG